MNISGTAALVKQAVDIVEVIGQVVPLRRSGNRHIGLCPFHQEKTPSFHVDAENQFYHCFGCGSGGDVLSFVMKHQNLTFAEALKYLADRYHITLPEQDSYQGVSAAAGDAVRREREQLYRILQSAADFFYDQLHHTVAGREAREYVRRRGLPEQVVESERLGYAPQKWDALLRCLTDNGFSPELGLKAGLFARSEAKNRVYDRFRNRLIFPIRDESGRIAAFGGRSLSGETEGEPKYLNSPETPVYQKGRLLYQLAKAREACRQVRQVVLVEGYMDLLAFYSQGFYRVAATLGTALTPNQVRLLSRMAEEVVMAYDGDEAGEKAMLRGLPLFLQEELSVSCVRFPDGMDPDDFLKRGGLGDFEVLLRNRQELGVYAVRKALDGWDGSTSGKTKILADLKLIFDSVHQPVLRSEYMRVISDRLSLSEEVIRKQLDHGKHRQERHLSPSRAPVPLRITETHSLEEKVLRLMVRYPDLIEDAIDSGASDYFREPKLRAVAMVLAQAPHPPGGIFNATMVYDLLPDQESKEIFTRFLLESSDLEEPRVQFMDWLEMLSRREVKQKSLELETALKQAAQKGDTAQVESLLAQIQSLNSTKKRVGDIPDNL